MNKRDKLRRKFIADNIKVNATVCSYPLRTVTPNTSSLLVNSLLPFDDKTVVITETKKPLAFN